MIRALTLAATAALLPISAAHAQEAPFDRLPREVLDIIPPSARVSGEPGSMRITDLSCRSLPDTNLRRRIIDVAAQEWAFFGFSVRDQTQAESFTNSASSNYSDRRRSHLPRLSPSEARRLADSIGGYWSAAPDSGWILRRQNDSWNRSGVNSRWRDPWSAAFISWVMCESGLGDSAQFKRAIAHHSYIDQAILARDEKDTTAAYMAYDLGDTDLAPGDILCRGSRPAYRNISQRRDQLGVGARTHCDIVVKVDVPNNRIMAIGGNVRGSVRMKLIPVEKLDGDSPLRPLPGSGRAYFAHLKLNADPIEDEALDLSATISSLACRGFQSPGPLVAIVATTASLQTCGASQD
ncbi:MAG: DUF2272 domain-containing protein [Pseudohongiellaceae bacterium]